MSAFIESSPALLILTAFLGYCTAMGHAVCRRLELWPAPAAVWDNLYLRWFFALSLGMTISIALLFLLGVLGLLSQPAVLAVAGASALYASFARLGSRDAWRRTWVLLRSRVNYLHILTCVLLFLTIVFRAFHAPGHWDDTMYQLPIARHYLEHQALTVNEYLRFPLFPQNINLLLALGLMLQGDLLAQCIATAPVFVIGLGLIGAGISLTGSSVPGVLITLVLLTLRPVAETIGYAYVDNGLALLCWAATLALAQWVAGGRRSPGWLVASAMLAGGAAGSKYFGAVLAAVLVLYLLAAGRDWKAAVRYVGVMSLFACWWYVRSAVISGDPVHPAGGHIFGFYLWNADDLLGQKQEQATHGVGRNPLHLWSALTTAGVPWWGLAFVSLAFWRSAPPSVRVIQFSFVVYFTFWFFVTQVERYLAPIYGAGSLLSFYGLYRLATLAPQRRIVDTMLGVGRPAVAGLLCLLMLAPALRYSLAGAATGLKNWQIDLAKREGYSIMREANRLSATHGQRLLQVGFEVAIYFFDGAVIGDHFGLGRYRDGYACDSGTCRLAAPDVLQARMDRFGTRMLAINTRKVRFDRDAYLRHFKLAAESDDGVLLIAGPSPAQTDKTPPP